MSNMSDLRPIALSDSEMAAVLAAAHPIPPHRRNEFLRAVAAAVSGGAAAELGCGSLHRIIVAVQREYFDPPDL
jgi:hypothetical protein